MWGLALAQKRPLSEWPLAMAFFFFFLFVELIVLELYTDSGYCMQLTIISSNLEHLTQTWSYSPLSAHTNTYMCLNLFPFQS